MTDHLITSRRNFLVRATAYTVAGGAVRVPIITVATPRRASNITWMSCTRRCAISTPTHVFGPG
jgi:hypothetical protein